MPAGEEAGAGRRGRLSAETPGTLRLRTGRPGGAAGAGRGRARAATGPPPPAGAHPRRRRISSGSAVPMRSWATRAPSRTELRLGPGGAICTLPFRSARRAAAPSPATERVPWYRRRSDSPRRSESSGCILRRQPSRSTTRARASPLGSYRRSSRQLSRRRRAASALRCGSVVKRSSRSSFSIERLRRTARIESTSPVASVQSSLPSCTRTTTCPASRPRVSRQPWASSARYLPVNGSV